MLGLSGPPGMPCAGLGSPWVPPHGQQSEDVADEGESEERGVDAFKLSGGCASRRSLNQ
ncbi:hypothetical protein M9458_057950, partial [Cirrhinus mrigala]